MNDSNAIKKGYSKTQPISINNKWWVQIEESLVGIDLKGLKIICPKCGETGLVITRWVKGITLKPIYIMHFKRGKVRKICELNKKQSKNIRGNIPVLESDIKKLLKSHKSFVLFSGGKDSLATLVYLNNIAKKTKNDLVAIFVDTTAGLPENTEYVKRVCKYLRLNLKIVRPEVDYFTLAKKWGIPSFRSRWCCRELKIKPIQAYLNSIKKPKVIFDGIRAAESNVRKKYIPIWYHPSFKCLSVSAIFYWNDDQVISFINSNGIPKTLLHSIGTSAECWCGAYKTEADFKKLYEFDKNMFYKLVEVEKENKNRFTFLYKNGHKIPLIEVERQILEEEKRNSENR